MNFSITKILLFSLFTLSLISLKAQKSKLPDSLFTNVVKTEFKINDSITQEFYIEYPKGYNENKKYPVFIGLAGGNQSIPIVRYCYAAYFNSVKLNNYIKVIPIAYNKEGFLSYGKDYYISLIQSIEKNISCKSKNWLIGGTSNGGISAFRMVSINPSKFSGIAVMPGVIQGDNISVNKKWSHIKVLLAYGENDTEDWKNGIIETDSILKNNSVKTKVMMLPEQGHILELGYDIDSIYSIFFKL